MRALSIDLRKRIVEHYLSEPQATYSKTATLFRVGEATVSRLLRLHRETGDVKQPEVVRESRSRVDLEWLETHARSFPDARLVDRVEAFEKRSGIRVSVTAMWFAMESLGWTHKKRPSSLVNKIANA